MRVSLEGLEARGLVVDLPGPGALHAAVSEARGLRGALTQSDGTLTLSDVRAVAVALASLRLPLGSVVVSTESAAVFSALTLALTRDAAGLRLQLSAEVDAEALGIDTPSLSVRGRARLVGAKLSVTPGAGALTASYVEIEGLTLRTGAVTVTAPALRWEGFAMSWGEVFRLEGQRLVAASVEVSTGRVTLQLHDATVDRFTFAGGDLTADGVSLGRAEVLAALGGDAPETAPPGEGTATPNAPPVTSHTPLVDLNLLDAVSGRVDVDVSVDVTVPILGSRRATHHLRVPIDVGALDYLALENNLAPLENSLLDFALRDTGLVLERGLPLLPTRGRGKPIVVWDLDGDDLALARRNRIRLARLPKARLAREATEAPPEEGPRPPAAITLRHLTLGHIDVALRLAPHDTPFEAVLRHLQAASVTLVGAVSHDPGQPPRPGQLRGAAEAVGGELRGLALGTKHLDVAALALARLDNLEVDFEGLRPRAVRGELAGVVLRGVALRSPAPDTASDASDRPA